MSPAVPDATLDADIAILGQKGAGKTYAAKGVVERLLAEGARVLVIDPLSTWWGLRSSADGERPGFPVAVFGGPHGDLPLEEGMAGPLAALLAAENLPSVLDIAFMSKAASRRLLSTLLAELFRLNRDPLTLVLEEAHVFAPQSPSGDETGVFAEVDRIARMGRAFGFRLLTMTQRPARLHKDVLSQAATLVALRLRAPQDRDAVRAWVDGNGDRDKAREVYDSLANLDVGEGWVWAAELGTLERVRFPAITSLDTSATPKRGQTRISPKRLAEVDLSAIRAALAEAVPDMRPASRAGTAVRDREPSAEALRDAEVRGYARGFAEGQRQGLAQGEMAGRAMERARIAKGLRELIPDDEPVEAPTPSNSRPARRESADAARHQRAPRPLTSEDRGRERRALRPDTSEGDASAKWDALSPSARKVLDVVLAVHPRTLTYPTAAARAGLSKRSSTYRRYRQELIDARLVEERELRLHAVGEALNLARPAPPTLDAWYRRLVPSEAAMLRVLSTASAPLSRDELAQRSGISRTSSGLGNAIRQLVALGLAETDGANVRITQGLLG